MYQGTSVEASGFLHELGFGERYTLDQADSSSEQISYCTKLAYCTKQVLEGPENELVHAEDGIKTIFTLST